MEHGRARLIRRAANGHGVLLHQSVNVGALGHHCLQHLHRASHRRHRERRHAQRRQGMDIRVRLVDQIQGVPISGFVGDGRELQRNVAGIAMVRVDAALRDQVPEQRHAAEGCHYVHKLGRALQPDDALLEGPPHERLPPTVAQRQYDVFPGPIRRRRPQRRQHAVVVAMQRRQVGAWDTWPLPALRLPVCIVLWCEAVAL